MYYKNIDRIQQIYLGQKNLCHMDMDLVHDKGSSNIFGLGR